MYMYESLQFRQCDVCVNMYVNFKKCRFYF